MKFISATHACAFIAAALACIAAPTESKAQTYFFDFGDGNGTSFDDFGNYWNTVPNSVSRSNDQILTGIVDSLGGPAFVQLEMVSRFNNQNGNGTTSFGVTEFPVTATQDSMFGNTATFENLTNVTPKFRLTGLDLTKAYNLTFYASRTGAPAGEIRTTEYVVTGSAVGSAELNVANNISEVARVFSIAPAPTTGFDTGELLIQLFPGEFNQHANKFTYLGALKVEAIPEPTAALMVASGIGILAIRRRRRNL